MLIKHYDGSALTRFIMISFHEEIHNIEGKCDLAYANSANFETYFKTTYGELPSAILFLWNVDPKIAAKIKAEIPSTKIVLWTDDLHWYKEEAYQANLRDFKLADVIISHYDYYKMFYNLDVSSKLIKMTHCCGSHFERDQINYESENKLYLYGSIALPHYPLRQVFYDRIKKTHPDLIEYKPHPGYGAHKIPESVVTSDALYKCSFAFTSGAFPKFSVVEKADTPYYLVGKFFEICGSGVLLLCNNYGVESQLEAIGFEAGIHYLNINTENHDEVMAFILAPENKDKILKIRENGFNLVKSKFVPKVWGATVTEQLKTRFNIC
jgi:hypothetical protein